MIVNAPGILALLFAALELLGGAALVVAAVRGLRPGARDPGSGFAWEPFRHLLLLLVLLLAVLAAASLLAWVLLLQSYVPQWADVRCVVGVLKVGSRSDGAASGLPALATTTSGLRLALLFAAGYRDDYSEFHFASTGCRDASTRSPIAARAARTG